ncbi:Gfo/Idh/MocA family oxidoreductase [Congregibacter brevis]|uniref:Gfo/Idh/MocA family oxidoreductase n=1 Tax=Congregibacter brevis TaxID=3081201 RepID=A0ABZ0IGK2_9GAMM|nr:Gfo/Idh/MocA family oxidoreductase [Congregibacter sp. IMCC45268]
MSKVRMGMVGGGEGAFIGAIHRMAAALDQEIELVCGAFSSNTERSRRSGASLGLPDHRVYTSYELMMTAESELPKEDRMQFVSIVTPNHLHFPVAVAALKSGFHVLSDKPATFSLSEVLTMRKIIEKCDLIYGLTHPYIGYPMVQEAQHRVSMGAFGRIRKILVDYNQGWLANDSIERESKQAAWRLDPSKAGISSCMGDIGVHAANLAEFVSGLRITELCADLTSFVPGRELDDDGSVLLRFDGGAKGVLQASQICTGEENALSLRVYGEKGGLEWSQQNPNSLRLKWPDRPDEIVRTAADYLSDSAAAATRTPAGHPEGYLEAFANLYLAFATRVRVREFGEGTDTALFNCPGITEAVRGMAFIELAVTASQSDIKWHRFESH